MIRLKVYYDPTTKQIKALEGDLDRIEQTKLIGKIFRDLDHLKELIKQASKPELKSIEIKVEEQDERRKASSLKA